MDTEFRHRKPINENNNLIEDANQNVGIFVCDIFDRKRTLTMTAKHDNENQKR